MTPLVKTFGVFFLSGAVCQYVNIALLFVNPQILNLLITFVEEKQEKWKGYLYIVLLGIVSFTVGRLLQ